MLKLHKHTIYTARAQRIFIQQQILTFYVQGHFLFVVNIFHIKISYNQAKIENCLKTLPFLPSQIFI